MVLNFNFCEFIRRKKQQFIDNKVCYFIFFDIKNRFLPSLECEINKETPNKYKHKIIGEKKLNATV